MNIYFTRSPMESRELLRRALTAEGALPCGAPLPPLRKSEHGKPYLAGGPAFNLTHTAGLVAVAIGECEVGLDAEKRAARRISSLSARLTEGERREDFFSLWTAKEAYIKYRGGSLAGMLSSLVYEGGALYENGAPAEAAFARFELGGYTLCLCTRAPVEAALKELLP